MSINVRAKARVGISKYEYLCVRMYAQYLSIVVGHVCMYVCMYVCVYVCVCVNVSDCGWVSKYARACAIGVGAGSAGVGLGLR